MDVLILLLFISLVFVTGAVLLFLRGVTSGDFEHGDRVSLLPLEPDSPVRSSGEGWAAVPSVEEAPSGEAARIIHEGPSRADTRSQQDRSHDAG